MDNSMMNSPSAGAAPRPVGDKGAKLRQACIDVADGDDLLFVDGHDGAILGTAERDGELCVVYDRAKIIQALRRSDGMDKAGAAEFFEYNIAGSWLGAGTPIFVALSRA